MESQDEAQLACFDGDERFSGWILHHFLRTSRNSRWHPPLTAPHLLIASDQQTPIFEQTVNLNDQGVANFFRYDYADYSLILKLKKINLVNLDCN